MTATPFSDPRTGSGGDRPRVSVIVPFFNSEDHIGACLESLDFGVLDEADVAARN